jgi:transposase
LERREVMIPCHPDDCRCDQCGAERPVIGYERSEELVCEPATFHVRVTLREKRGSHCQEEQGVATAPAPAKIVPKSKLANEFIIEALARKYQQHTPGLSAMRRAGGGPRHRPEPGHPDGRHSGCGRIVDRSGAGASR